MPKCIASVLVGSLSLSVAAQAVHTVGPGQTHAQIQDAIDVALDGDVVLVAAGSYAQFVCAKSLSIRALVPGSTVTVGALQSPPTLWLLANDKVAGVDGLSFDCLVQVSAVAAVGGVLTCESAEFLRGITVTDAALNLSRCDVTGWTRFGLHADGTATVSASGSTFTRFGGFSSFPVTADAVRASGQSVVHLSRCQLTGGLGILTGHTTFHAGDGLGVEGAARVSLADCTLQGHVYTPGQPFTVVPGFAIDNQSSLPVVADRCTLANSTAPVTQGVVDTSSYLLGASTPTPRMVGGTVFQIDFDARQGMPIVVHAAFGLQRPQLLLPVLAQPEWGFATDSFVLAFLVPDPAGRASLSVPLPAASALPQGAVWFLAWSGLEQPLQLSPPIGGWLD